MFSTACYHQAPQDECSSNRLEPSLWIDTHPYSAIVYDTCEFLKNIYAEVRVVNLCAQRCIFAFGIFKPTTQRENHVLMTKLVKVHATKQKALEVMVVNIFCMV